MTRRPRRAEHQAEEHHEQDPQQVGRVMDGSPEQQWKECQRPPDVAHGRPLPSGVDRLVHGPNLEGPCAENVQKR